MIVVTSPPAPAWLPVMGAEVLFAPIDRPMLRRARRLALASLDRENVDTDADAAAQLEELGDALSYQLIVAGARDWRGVYAMPSGDDVGAGQSLAFSREALDQALADPVTFDAFDAAYVQPFATRERERAAPGNASAASPSTTGASETQEPTIAGSPATASAADAPSAPTGSTKPRPRPKRASGRS